METETQRGPLYFTREAGHNNNIPTPVQKRAQCTPPERREQTEAICALAARRRPEKGHEIYTYNTWGCIYLHRRAHHTAVCVIMRPIVGKFHVHYYQKVLCVSERTRNFSSAIATWKYYFTLLLKVLAACAPGKTLLSAQATKAFLL